MMNAMLNKEKLHYAILKLNVAITLDMPHFQLVKRFFNHSSGCVEEWYHNDCQRYTTPLAGKGPDWMFDYDGLSDSLSPLVDVETEDLVCAYLEEELLSTPRSSTTYVVDQL